MVCRTEEALLPGQTVLCMKVSGKIINVKVRVLINGVTETYMRATGKITARTVREL